jgi:hypothetical protein
LKAGVVRFLIIDDQATNGSAHGGLAMERG